MTNNQMTESKIVSIPASHKDLVEKPVVTTLVTVSPEGKPYAAPVWVSYDGEYFRVSCDYGSRKHRNLQSNRNVTLVTLDPKNPYRYLEVAGVVDEMGEAGALEHLDHVTMLYLGKPRYFGDVEPAAAESKYRGILLKIRPTRTVAIS